MIKKGLKVRILTGRDRKKEGEVIEIDRPNNRAKVQGINIVKKHVKTTKEKKDDKLVRYLSKKKIKFFRGNNENCLNRYFYAAKKFNIQTVVRITGDCPLVDSKLVDEFIKEFKKKKVEYLSNTFPYSFPDGLDIEVFSFDFLRKVFKVDGKKKQLENVVIDYFRKNYKKINEKITFTNTRI